jgi:hypothetical protein
MEGQTVTRRSCEVGGVKRLVPMSLIVAAILLGGLYYLGRPEHKYRLTIEVQTPGGVRSASGVMAVHMGKDGGILSEAGGRSATKGDAIFVDLGNGRNLIGTLTHGKNGLNFDGMNDLAMNAFAEAGRRVQFKEVSRLTGKVQVYGNLIPTLVTFANVADPNTVRVLDPANIEAVFGSGFHLDRVILEMVPVGFWPLDFGGQLGEPVTRGIQKRLPWIAQQKSQGLGGRINGHPDRFTVNVPYFER